MLTYYAGFVPYEGSVSVIFPDVPGCATWGENMEHALAMSLDALAVHLEAMVNDGDPIPMSSNRAVAWKALVTEYATYGLGPLPEGTTLHPVPAPKFDMRTKQVSVSFRKYSLDMIDRKARNAGMTRSGFLTVAASAFESRV